MKKNRSLAIFVVIAISLVFSQAETAFAVTAEEILDVLVKKGIISQDEAQVLLKTPPKAAPESKAATPAPAAADVEMKPATATVAKDKPKEEIVAKFKDGITWESADKGTMIGLRGRIEADYRHFLGNDALGANTWDLRRAYLAVEGRFYDDIDFRVRMNFSDTAGPTATVCTAVGTNTAGVPVCTATSSVATTSTTSLDEAWLNLGWWKSAQIKMGQTKMPLGLDQNTSDIFTDFQERSMGDALMPGKERGVVVYGSPLKGFYYGIAHSNGQGRNGNETNENVDGQDWIGRATVNVAEIADIKDTVIHFGGGLSTGTIPVAAAPTGRTEARGIQFFRPSAFSGDDVDRTRYALETVLAWGPLKLQSEFFRANFDGTSSTGAAYSRDINAYYVNLNWLVTGECYADFFRGDKMSRIRPKGNFAPGKTCCGAWELGLRYSKFDAGDFNSNNAVGTGVIPTTGTSVAKAWTAGVKWIVNPNTRFLLNYVRTDIGNTITVTPSAPGKATQTDKESAITFRGQFDF
jgi:phosphate-selective porin OprO and OprP